MVERMLSMLEAWGSISSTRDREESERGSVENQAGSLAYIVSSQVCVSPTDEETAQRSQATSTLILQTSTWSAALAAGHGQLFRPQGQTTLPLILVGGPAQVLPSHVSPGPGS